ncbi:MAG: hypothetical protein Q4F34_05280, partial [Prevotellaceae bacterium]|nr:hypothetical protein [Prevotellaceae bacterium]
MRHLRFFLVILLVGIFASMSAQKAVKVYSGRSSYTSDIICNIKDGKVYKKNSTYTSDILCSVRGKKIYNGNS